jgi:hypothetical protein
VSGREIASLVFCIVCGCTSGAFILAGSGSGSWPSSDATSVIRDEMTLGGRWDSCGFVKGGLPDGGGIDKVVSPDAITAMSLTVVLSDDITSNSWQLWAH